jgi:hypothetical protein
VPFASVTKQPDGSAPQVVEIDRLMELIGLAPSRKEAQRLLTANAVTVGDSKQTERHFVLGVGVELPLRWRIRVGRRQKIAVIG